MASSRFSVDIACGIFIIDKDLAKTTPVLHIALYRAYLPGQGEEEGVFNA
jgi:hypothetical protein